MLRNTAAFLPERCYPSPFPPARLEFWFHQMDRRFHQSSNFCRPNGLNAALHFPSLAPPRTIEVGHRGHLIPEMAAHVLSWCLGLLASLKRLCNGVIQGCRACHQWYLPGNHSLSWRWTVWEAGHPPPPRCCLTDVRVLWPALQVSHVQLQTQTRGFLCCASHTSQGQLCGEPVPTSAAAAIFQATGWDARRIRLTETSLPWEPVSR